MLDLFTRSEGFTSLRKALREGKDILIEELWNAPKVLVTALAAEEKLRHVLLLTGATREENRLLLDFPFFTGLHVVDFPPWETLPQEGVPPSPDTVGERYQLLHRLRGESGPTIIVSVLQAALQRLITPNLFDSLRLTLHVGMNLELLELSHRLEEMGYRKRTMATDKGEYAIRGTLIDLFPVSSSSPHRFQFIGGELEEIRIYDPISQLSVDKVRSVEVMPAHELELLQKSEGSSSLIDYLGEETLVVIDDLLSIEDRAVAISNMSSSSSRHFSSFHALWEQLAPLQKIYLSPQPIEELSEVHRNRKEGTFRWEMFGRTLEAVRWNHPFVSIPEYLLPHHPDGAVSSSFELFSALGTLEPPKTLYIVGESGRERSQFLEKLALKISHVCYEGYLSSGFAIEDGGSILFPMTEVTHRYKMRRQKLRSAYHSTTLPTLDLKPGDLVVHFNHGIGKFLSIERRVNHLGILSEFFHIAYGDGSTLYVPAQQAHLLTKYIGATDAQPSLSSLTGGRWKKAKEQTQKAVEGYAKDLLALYAQRQVKHGFAFAEDSPDMLVFEEEFPFVETEDQLEAIQKVKVDMQTPKPMDRLVCGDVGYGKTEVAMRAAFKAVVDGGKQVALLVPTTVLAMQHYENFCERMHNFSLRIGVLSRFVTAKEVAQTLKALKEGEIDILIGTHRIISKDVEFKDLGLVIIDEEQRFGVRVKEHLKKIKVEVDCLTLSATPIPRTLHMALVGARDLSTINTPPEDRLPIATVIVDSSDEVIRHALLRELARDGQAYVVHNRVESIYRLSERIQGLIPHARTAVVHGQMEAHELDAIFYAFRRGEVDVLIATTIIENGVDIPNANTILIDRADQYGLATLYQMRGRVGRWNRRAYAYLMVNDSHSIREDARQRLEALCKVSGHGGGLKIAMQDLEMRGAGEFLGMGQSGHVATIGFHFYCKLLKRAVDALQGNPHPQSADLKLEFPIDSRLPDFYIEEVSLRMEIYQRFGDALSVEEIDLLWKELLDRFGPPPENARWLYHMARLRIQAAAFGYISVKWEKGQLFLERKLQGHLLSSRVPFPSCHDPEFWEKKLLDLLSKKF